MSRHSFSFPMSQSPNRRVAKQIQLLDTEGQVIRSYPSVSEAARRLNTSVTTLYTYIRENRPFKGFMLKCIVPTKLRKVNPAYRPNKA